MPTLVASGRHAVAIDPPGIGDSSHPANGYELKSIAKYMHEFSVKLNPIKPSAVDVVGHDIGSWISYAYASAYSADVRCLALFDAALPGLTILPLIDIPNYETNLKSWHFVFNRLNDLPEILVSGHEREYLSWIFMNKTLKNWMITVDDVDEYVRVFKKPGAIRASFSYYRAAFSPEGLMQNRKWAQEKLKMPVLVVGASKGVGNLLYKTVESIASNVEGKIVEGCGHFIPEECPDIAIEHLIQFFKYV